jgi:hypothetical protein
LADVNAGFVAPNLPVYDLSTNPLILSPGAYLVGAREFTTVNNGAISMTNSLFQPNTVFGSINNGPWATIESLGFPNTPIIRPKLVPVCSAFNISGGMTSTDVTCNGSADGTATLTPTGGTASYTFAWDAAAGNQTTPSISNLASGTYFVTITDANGCSTIDSVTIVEPTVVGTSGGTSTDVTCNGANDGTASVVASGGTPAYTYSWSASAGNQTTAAVSNLAPGVHFITITDANGCSTVDSVIILEPTALVGSVLDNGDGTATASATGGTPGYTYLWDAAAGNQTTATTTVLPNGTYTVTITDMNGCTTTQTVTIATSSINELNNIISLNIFPNPAKDKVIIKLHSDLDKMEDVMITVYDFSGKTVLNKIYDSSENGSYLLNVEALASGIYTLNVVTGNSLGMERISILK